jgi:hypothetical protein
MQLQSQLLTDTLAAFKDGSEEKEQPQVGAVGLFNSGNYSANFAKK